MRRIAKTFWLFCSLSLSAFGAQAPSGDPGDVYVFLNALGLSYNNYHSEARAGFEKYKQNHPDDLLSRLRIMYDRTSEVHFKDMDQATYEELLGQVNEAIGVFERVKKTDCAGTDFANIAQNLVDCEYVGAALYSFRAALCASHQNLAGKYKIRGALHTDDDKFFDHAKRSKSILAQFLIGVHEYELSQNFFGPVTGDPHNRREGLEIIKRSMVDESPFADDVWFYILRQETENPSIIHNFADTPPAVIVARLALKHPNHKYLPLK